MSVPFGRHQLEPWWVGPEAQVKKGLVQVRGLKQGSKECCGRNCRSLGPVPPSVTLEFPSGQLTLSFKYLWCILFSYKLLGEKKDEGKWLANLMGSESQGQKSLSLER